MWRSMVATTPMVGVKMWSRRSSGVVVAAATLLLSLLPHCCLCHSAVLTLDSKTFAAAVQSNPLLFVNFYAPWCGHSKRLAPEFESASEALRGRVTFARVDAAMEHEFTEHYQLEGYPTLYLLKRGLGDEYPGARRNASMVDWILKEIGPALVKVTDEELAKQLENRKGSLIVATGGLEFHDIVSGIAEENRILGTYVFQTGSSTEPEIKIHRGIKETFSRSGPELLEQTAILEFLRMETLPLFGEIGQHNFAVYSSRASAGMLWVMLSPTKCHQEAAELDGIFGPVASELLLAGIPTAYVDTKVYADHVKQELGCSRYPSGRVQMALQLGNLTAAQDMALFRASMKKDGLTAEAVIEWVRNAQAGNIDQDDGLDALDVDADFQEEEEVAADASTSSSSAASADAPAASAADDQQQQQPPTSSPEETAAAGAGAEAEKVTQQEEL